jgi:NADH dehydrogenase [ubiquinone] 1 alpha subcomplex assembly factor 7
MAQDYAPLEEEIRRRIAFAGPMPVAQYMTLCLTHSEHGYYITRDPLGTAGDFVTAPEISQMFGELIGLWAAAAWRSMGSPENVRLVELGPGRGSLMLDALRAAKVMPDFRTALVVHFVEISPVLEQFQREAFFATDVPVSWHQSLSDVPDGPMIVIANEFFDALPVHQAVMCADGWHERVVKIGEDDNLHFSIDRDPIPLFDQFLPSNLRPARIGEIFEWRTDQMALELTRRVVRSGGVALLIDYGHAQTAIGDTLQAVRGHEFANPLLAPGMADLTAHVDFQALGRAAESMRARVHGPIEQGEFLRRLGIEQRAAALKVGAPPDHAVAIQAALVRLTGDEATGMGRLIKVVGLSAPKLGQLPGFDDGGGGDA